MQAQEPVLLTTCAAVRALSESQAARGLPVHVKAVVTLVPSDAPGRLTVDDGTGIWVAAPPSSEAETSVGQARVGDVVEIEGHTHEGRFAPTITIARLRIVGRAKLPPARRLARKSAGAQPTAPLPGPPTAQPQSGRFTPQHLESPGDAP